MLCDILSFKGNELILRQVIGKSKDEELLIVESLDKSENIHYPWEHLSQGVKNALL